MLAMSSVFCTCFQNIVENICICVSIEIVFYTAMLKTFANIIEVKKIIIRECLELTLLRH